MKFIELHLNGLTYSVQADRIFAFAEGTDKDPKTELYLIDAQELFYCDESYLTVKRKLQEVYDGGNRETSG